ncbi:uronyl 2-sulfotransferase [Cricetulus griseus]|uniref:Uronyl 2-sulfotransferase n=1 Tax=Cricetulus griseus TaxID=10029 RepID=A0A061IGB5_CRIGR|nr:uronyl 2-sulfotransferase [Cricetulus griseus]
MKKKQQQHPSSGEDPWPHGAPVGGAPPCLGGCKRRIPLLPFLRFSLRDYGFCMATLLVFCLGSLFYQLSGGPPRFLLDLRQYLGKGLETTLSCGFGSLVLTPFTGVFLISESVVLCSWPRASMVLSGPVSEYMYWEYFRTDLMEAFLVKD